MHNVETSESRRQLFSSDRRVSSGRNQQTALHIVDEELRAWATIGAVPHFWWRDDDAHQESGALQLLRELLSEETLLLAVVPGLLQESLVRSMNNCPKIAIIQHGWMHLNHAAAGAPPSEYPDERERTEIENELSSGQRVLLDAFPKRFHPVFVPPWHRCAVWILREARSLGFDGVSGQAPPFPLLRHGYPGERNIEIDLSDWTTNGQFVGADRFAARIVKALKLRREWSAFDAPIGVLSHHERITREDFRSLRELIAVLRLHGVQWESPTSLFPVQRA
jgi:hypothetical protein